LSLHNTEMIQKNLLKTPIEYLKGVGPQKADLLKKQLGVFTFEDLLQHFPNRYIDRTKYYKINEILPTFNTEIQIIGKIIHLKTIEQKRGKRLVATFADDTGKMELTWFQGYKWLSENLKINQPYVIFGKTNLFGGIFSMPHPEMELLSEHQQNIKSVMQPVYPSTETLTKKNISSRVIHRWIQQIFLDIKNNIPEVFPDYLVEKYNFMSKSDAFFNIHFPQSLELLNKALFRLKFEELFFIQLQLVSQNLIRKRKIKGHKFEKVGDYFNTFFKNHLKFELTQAQKRVIKEIRNDVGTNAQMNRLLQGDVGSGKTIVAFMTILIALDNNFQACMVAPTEILAIQHFETIRGFAEKLNINIRLLTGSTKIAQRRIIHQELENGSLQILVGTHAVLEEKVKFANLGLAIIDEQHRFGVEQRAKLWKKNAIPPHILVMTATPIPRTLAMSLYGDLDISVIDELPKGRKPIITSHRFDNARLKVWKFMKEQIQQGRQIYVVFPLIQESETMDYKDLQDGYEALSRDFPLPKYAISVVHGKMKPEEKDYEMKRFAQGKTNIMVATTVIEVGVDVPNASVMIIESAERFGLSQLHQLRGRVGRGAEQSYCILMTSYKLSSDSKTRIETMCSTNDGFQIAEVDLKLRGPGDLMGTQQSGILNLKIADVVKDKEVLSLARATAFDVLRKDASLSLPEHNNLRETFLEISKKKTSWNLIS